MHACIETDQIIVRLHINTFNKSIRVTADIFSVVTNIQRLYRSIHTKSDVTNQHEAKLLFKLIYLFYWNKSR